MMRRVRRCTGDATHTLMMCFQRSSESDRFGVSVESGVYGLVTKPALFPKAIGQCCNRTSANGRRPRYRRRSVDDGRKRIVAVELAMQQPDADDSFGAVEPGQWFTSRGECDEVDSGDGGVGEDFVGRLFGRHAVEVQNGDGVATVVLASQRHV